MKSTPTGRRTVKETRELMGMASVGQGMSKKTVVLLPGLFAGAWIWDHTRRRLSAQGYRVVAVADPFALLDLGTTPISKLRSYVKEYFDKFKIGRTVLCGNSFGALVALDFAFHFPHRVDALVISGSPGLPSETKPHAIRTGAISVESAYAIADLLCYDRACLTDDMVATTYALLAHRKVLINIARALKAARDHDVRCILPHIDCPVLMIWGTHDCMTPVAEWERNVRLVKQGTLKKVERCGHCPMLEQPYEFNALLLEFLNQRADDRVTEEACERIG